MTYLGFEHQHQRFADDVELYNVGAFSQIQGKDSVCFGQIKSFFLFFVVGVV